jgi:hypothetical protein
MTKTDPAVARKRLAEYYASLAESDLRRLADNGVSLTETAREILAAELSRREVEAKVQDRARAEVQAPHLVVLKEFRDLPEALLAKGVLDSAGIECFLFNENMIRMDWFLSNAIGGIKLLVKQDNSSLASELLNHEPMERFDVTDSGEFKQPHCPQCNSLNVTFGGTGKRLSYVTLAVGLPLPVSRGRWKCDSCGYEWHGIHESQENENPGVG